MNVELVRPGEGEQIFERARITGAREELVITDFDYRAGLDGPPPHIHREHADCFWSLAGELTFPLGPDGEERRVAPGSFVLVPPGVVHTFRNKGPEEAHFLNVHAPGKGFDEYMRAMRDGRQVDFDSFDPPDDGGRPAADVLLRGPGEGDESELGGARLVLKAGREHEPGGLTLAEGTLPAGASGPPLYSHERDVDCFYVLGGTLTISWADGSVHAEPGTLALVPPGTDHSFANESDAEVSFLNLVAGPAR